MKYRDLWLLCEKCLESFDLLPPNSVVTIDDHIENSINNYNAKIEHDITRQQTLQISSTKKPGAEVSDEAWKEKTMALIVQPEETIFIRETVRGVDGNNEMLQLAFAAYQEGMKRNKQHRLPLNILTYLLLFRYEELGGELFRSLIDQCAPYPKLAEYITFLTDRDLLEQYVVPKWRTAYDDVYTEEVLVGSLLSIKPNLEFHVLNWLLAKGTSQAKAEEKRQALLSASLTTSPKKKTSEEAEDSSPRNDWSPPSKVPKSPLFTKRQEPSTGRILRASELLPPYEIREMIHMEPLPKLPRIADRATTPEKEAVTAAKRGEKRSTLNPAVRQQNREKETQIPFRSFSATARPTNLPKLLEEEKFRREGEMKPLFANRPSPTEVRKKLEEITGCVDVKTTNAALLREEMLYAKRREEEELAFKRKMGELRDDSEFQEWKRKGEEQDEIGRLAAVAQRKVDMMIIDEEAKAAKARQQEKNLQVSRQYRNDVDKHREEKEKETRKVQVKRFARAKEIRAETEHVAKHVKAQLTEANAKIVKQQLEIKQQNEMKVAMALELERERKQEMIRRIKEVHEASVKVQREARERRSKLTAVDMGKLVTMTYDELQQKLIEVKEEHEALVEQRRVVIIAQREKGKEQREHMAVSILAERQRHREKKTAEREARRAKEAEIKEKARVVEEKQLIELQTKLQTKREDRARTIRERQEEDRQRRLAAQLLSADANAVEKAKWEEMNRGAENTILSAQNQRLKDNRVDRKRDAGIVNLREKNIETAHTVWMTTLQEKEDAFVSKRQRYFEESARDQEYMVNALHQMKEEQRQRQLYISQGP